MEGNMNVGQGNRTFLSDVIGEDYKNWLQGSAIMIKAPTGCGKSYFILHKLLSEYARPSIVNSIGIPRRILYMVNRKILKEQLIQQCKEIERKLTLRYGTCINIWNYIKIYTYQEIEYQLKNGAIDPLGLLIKDKDDKLTASYYYTTAVYDECHYFYADADFNPGAMESYNYLTKYLSGVTQIFMSATIENIEKKIRYDLETIMGIGVPVRDPYKMAANYDYIDLHYIEDSNEAVKLVEERKHEKWLIFIDNIKKGKELAKKLGELYEPKSEEQIAFIDARYRENEDGSKSMKELTVNELVRRSVLIATHVLDNGVSFKDIELRNLIIMADVEEEFIQMIGRKRQDGQNVSVYVCKRDRNYFNTRLNNVNENLKLYNTYKGLFAKMRPELAQQYILDTMFSSEKNYRMLKRFCYFKMGFIIMSELSYYKLLGLQEFYNRMVKMMEADENAFLKQQAQWLGFSEERIQEFLTRETGNRLNDNKRELLAALEELLEENEQVTYSVEENKKYLKKNKMVRELFIYFIRGADAEKGDNNIKKMITDLGKNDRPMQPETFNLCMDQAGLNFEMVKEGDKNFIIRRKVDKKE